MARRPARPVLTADHQADADRLHAALAEQLALTTNEAIFGANEFAVRHLVLGLGAKAVELAAADRAKKLRRLQRRRRG